MVVLQEGETCTQAALANVLGMSLKEVINIVGGGAVHPRQIQDYLIQQGKYLCAVDVHPQLPDGPVPCIDIQKYLEGNKCLLYVARGARRHMYAWKDGLIDPIYGYVSAIKGELMIVFILVEP